MPSWKTKGLLLLVHYHPLTSGVSVSWPYAVSASSHQVVLEDPTPLSLLHGPLHLFSFLHSIPVDLGFIHGLSSRIIPSPVFCCFHIDQTKKCVGSITK